MSATAVILARGGSKGLPRKNLCDVADRPCVAWTIEAARAATMVSRVILSTDDAAIARVGRRLDAEIHARPPELAGDTAPVDAAVRAAVAGTDAAVVVVLYGNVPVRPRGLIDAAVRMLASTRADSVQSFAAVGKHHPAWTARVDERTGCLEPWSGDVLFGGVHRRQELEPAFLPDGGVIAVTRAALEGSTGVAGAGPHAFLGVDRRAITTEPGDVVDIDDEVDRLVADAVLRSARGGTRMTARGGGGSPLWTSTGSATWSAA